MHFVRIANKDMIIEMANASLRIMESVLRATSEDLHQGEVGVVSLVLVLGFSQVKLSNVRSTKVLKYLVSVQMAIPVVGASNALKDLLEMGLGHLVCPPTNAIIHLEAFFQFQILPQGSANASPDLLVTIAFRRIFQNFVERMNTSLMSHNCLDA